MKLFVNRRHTQRKDQRPLVFQTPSPDPAQYRLMPPVGTFMVGGVLWSAAEAWANRDANTDYFPMRHDAARADVIAAAPVSVRRVALKPFQGGYSGVIDTGAAYLLFAWKPGRDMRVRVPLNLEEAEALFVSLHDAEREESIEERRAAVADGHAKAESWTVDVTGVLRLRPTRRRFMGDTTTGRWFRDDAGGLWYGKRAGAKSLENLHAAQLAAQLYRICGVRTPHTAIIVHDGEYVLVSREALGMSLPSLLELRQSNIGQGLVVDAWLGNTNVIGEDAGHVVLDGSRATRISLCSVFMFDGRGGRKAFTDQVPELEALCNRETQAGRVFGDVTAEDKARLLLRFAACYEAHEREISQIVQRSGLKQATTTTLLRKLKKRATWLVNEALPRYQRQVVVKAQGDPYGHTGYWRTDPRSGKRHYVKPKGQKPSETAPPARRRTATDVDLTQRPNDRTVPSYLNAKNFVKRTKHLSTAGINLATGRNPYKDNDDEREPDIPESFLRWVYTAVKNDYYESIDEMLDVLNDPDVWDDKEGKNRWTRKRARKYILRVFDIMRRDGVIDMTAKHVEAVVTDDSPHKRTWRLVARALLKARKNKDTGEARALVRRFLVGKDYGEPFSRDQSKMIHARSLGRADGVHAWDGTVKVRSDVLDDAIAHAWELGVASYIPLRSGKQGIHVLIHEELHGNTNFTPSAYQRAGVVIEEVATEVAARHRMRELRILPLGKNMLDPAAGATVYGPYGDFITKVRRLYMQVTDDTSIARASVALEAACIRYKKRTDRRTLPEEVAAGFAASFTELSRAQQQQMRSLLTPLRRAIIEALEALDRNDTRRALVLRRNALADGTWRDEYDAVLLQLQDDHTALLAALQQEDTRIQKADGDRKKAKKKPTQAAVRCGSVRVSLVGKALPKGTAEPAVRQANPIGASDKRAGAGGKTRYTYPQEKNKGPGAANPRMTVPKQAKPAEAPEQSVDPERFAQQFGIPVAALQQLASTHVDDKAGFVAVLRTRLKAVMKKHRLSADYFGKLFDSLHEAGGEQTQQG